MQRATVKDREEAKAFAGTGKTGICQQAREGKPKRLCLALRFAKEKIMVEKIFDIFIGRCGGWHTYRMASSQSAASVQDWLEKGYRIETEHQIGIRLNEVYLIRA